MRDFLFDKVLIKYYISKTLIIMELKMVKKLAIGISLMATLASADLRNISVDRQMRCDNMAKVSGCTDQEVSEKITIQQGKDYFIDDVGYMQSIYTFGDRVESFDRDFDGEDDYFIFRAVSEAKNSYIWSFDLLNKTIIATGSNLILIKNIK